MTHAGDKTLHARFARDVLEPLEPLELEEGKEVTLTITPAPLKPRADWLTRTAGGWTSVVDCEKLKRDIYESRSRIPSQEPRP